jgi:hypothetical protein
MAHARLLYTFLETPSAKRDWDDVLAEDFNYPAVTIPLPDEDRKRLNKDLMHLTYSRLRHDPTTKPWPDSILACLHDPVVDFMRHAEKQADLFLNTDQVNSWRNIITCMQSGRQMIIRSPLNSKNQAEYTLTLGHHLPSGKAALTKFGQPL